MTKLDIPLTKYFSPCFQFDRFRAIREQYGDKEVLTKNRFQKGVAWRKGKYSTLRPCDRPQGAEAAFLDALIRSPGVIAGQVNMVPVYWRDVSE